MIVYGNAARSGRVPRGAERVFQRAALRECPRCRRLLPPERFPRRDGEVLLCGDCAAQLASTGRGKGAGSGVAAGGTE